MFHTRSSGTGHSFSQVGRLWNILAHVQSRISDIRDCISPILVCRTSLSPQFTMVEPTLCPLRCCWCASKHSFFLSAKLTHPFPGKEISRIGCLQSIGVVIFSFHDKIVLQNMFSASRGSYPAASLPGVNQFRAARTPDSMNPASSLALLTDCRNDRPPSLT